MADSLASTVRRILGLLQPAFLSGYPLWDWFTLLHDNSWDVDVKYLPRAFTATLGATVTSLIRRLEPACRLDPVLQSLAEEPVFVIGMARSGTTHLFNLLARDERFCFPSRLDVYNPHTFLLLRSIGLHKLLGRIPGRTRGIDNVVTDWLSPDEDDIALTILCGHGAKRSAVFPRRRTYAEGYVEVVRFLSERPAAFRSAMAMFVQKLVHVHQRQVLLKSPSHMVAIPAILSLFPRARFVTILRDPFAHFASLSSMHMSSSIDWAALQAPPRTSDNIRMESISFQLARYVAARSTIPKGQLVEIRFEDLVADEPRTLERVYCGIGLKPPPREDQATPRRPYRRNKHPAITEDVRRRIADAYRPFIAAGLFEADALRGDAVAETTP